VLLQITHWSAVGSHQSSVDSQSTTFMTRSGQSASKTEHKIDFYALFSSWDETQTRLRKSYHYGIEDTITKENTSIKNHSNNNNNDDEDRKLCRRKI